MKLKIKDPSTLFGAHFWIALLYIIFIFMLMLGTFMWGKGSFSWAAYNQFALEICEGRGIVCLLAFKIFPWLALAFVGLTIYRIYTIFFSPKRPKNKIRTVEFLPEGVKLEYTKQTRPVLLPYQETQFILAAKCAMVSNDFCSFPKVIFCEFTFLQENKTISFLHYEKNAIKMIINLLKKENAFKKFELKVDAASDLSKYTTKVNRSKASKGIIGAIVEEQAADSIRATLEDYRKYGLICRFSKEERETLVYFFFAHLILSGMIGYELYKQPSVTRIVFVALFLSTGLLFIYLWYQDNQTAKQLARLKGKK